MNGPVVIYDKSVIRSLSVNDIVRLTSISHTVITPVLVWEICGEIEKLKNDESTSSLAMSFAHKANPIGSCATTEWRKLCLAELQQLQQFPIGRGWDRKPVIEGSHNVPLSTGGTALHIDAQPEKLALLSWSNGQWSGEHQQFSAKWHQYKNAIDIKKYQSRLPLSLPIPETPEQVRGYTSLMMEDTSLQPGFLHLVLDSLNLPKSRRNIILRYWLSSGLDWMHHCPFTSHCAKTLLTFHIAVSGGLLNQDPTNTIDLEYLMYLPFCTVFISNDMKSHGKIAPILMDSDQYFLNLNALKSELKTFDLTEDECLPVFKKIYSTWSNVQLPGWPPRNIFKTNSDPTTKSINPSTHDMDPVALMNEVKAKVDSDPIKYPPRPRWPH
ncbi:MAG: hypothetical protein ACSHX5_01330 [Phycisphaerales bacterium]